MCKGEGEREGIQSDLNAVTIPTSPAPSFFPCPPLPLPLAPPPALDVSHLWPPSSLWVELDREERLVLVLEPFVAAVVGVDKQRLPVCAERVGIHCKAVVLRGDVAAAVFEVDARLVLPAVSERKLVRRRARGQRKQLVPKANSKDWLVLPQCLRV